MGKPYKDLHYLKLIICFYVSYTTYTRECVCEYEHGLRLFKAYHLSIFAAGQSASQPFSMIQCYNIKATTRSAW